MKLQYLNDMSIRIKNGIRRRSSYVFIFNSHYVMQLLNMLLIEGLITSYSIYNNLYLKVFLKYTKDGISVIKDLKISSKTSLKNGSYRSKELLSYLKNSDDFIVILTSKGLFESSDIKKGLNRGGMLLLRIIK